MGSNRGHFRQAVQERPFWEGGIWIICWEMWRDLCLCLVAQCVQLCESMDCNPPVSSVHGNSPGKNTGVGCMSFFRGTSWSRNRTRVSCIAGGFFTSGATWEVPVKDFPGKEHSPVQRPWALQYSSLENPRDRGFSGRLLSMGSQRVRHDWATNTTF